RRLPLRHRGRGARGGPARPARRRPVTVPAARPGGGLAALCRLGRAAAAPAAGRAARPRRLLERQPAPPRPARPRPPGGLLPARPRPAPAELPPRRRPLRLRRRLPRPPPPARRRRGRLLPRADRRHAPGPVLSGGPLPGRRRPPTLPAFGPSVQPLPNRSS